MWILFVFRLITLSLPAVPPAPPTESDPPAQIAGRPHPPRPAPLPGPRPPKKPIEKRPVEDTTWGDLKSRFGGR